MATPTAVQRFVPVGAIAGDAPGWGGQDGDDGNEPSGNKQARGPVCWKCHGSGTAAPPPKRQRRSKSSKMRKIQTKSVGLERTMEEVQSEASSQKQQNAESAQVMEAAKPETSHNCSVCQGKGRLSPRKQSNQPGRITRACLTPDFVLKGPEPAGLVASAGTKGKWRRLVERADHEGVHVDLTPELLQGGGDDSMPLWIPRTGEELCHLTGRWRILQRVKSHRWTTDDLVTAWCAAHECRALPQRHALRYLDLGTGNSSVLSMVVWSCLCHDVDLCRPALGLEARPEAVALARRTLAFNVGQEENPPLMEIRHADFRGFRLSNDDDSKFDILTGTPPYFRVDFHMDKDSDAVVKKAVIRQGGMPTATASAPARCEFRGGIEVYLEAAARLLQPHSGRFVVCENWLNHDRVTKAAAVHHFEIRKLVRVEGRTGRGTLFAVYVMALVPPAAAASEKGRTADGARAPVDLESKTAKSDVPRTMQMVNLTVRDATGKWTREYLDTVMKDMNMPTGPANRAG